MHEMLVIVQISDTLVLYLSLDACQSSFSQVGSEGIHSPPVQRTKCAPFSLQPVSQVITAEFPSINEYIAPFLIGKISQLSVFGIATERERAICKQLRIKQYIYRHQLIMLICTVHIISTLNVQLNVNTMQQYGSGGKMALKHNDIKLKGQFFCYSQ